MKLRIELVSRVVSSLVLLFAAVLFSSCIGAGSATSSDPSGAGVKKGAMAAANPAVRPDVPQPDPAETKVLAGYKVEVFLKNLTYPTSAEFDGHGNLYVAEAGYSYGDANPEPRLLRVSAQGRVELVPVSLQGPITDLLWHENRLYVSHRGRISVVEGNTVHDLVTGLPSDGDHHNNQLSVGPDGKIYFGQGTASNAGVVGLDNHKMGWLTKHPRFHDIPARDIELLGREFLTANPLKLGSQQLQTAAFHPFGELAPVSNRVRGQTKANGTILRMGPDGSGLEVYAWGLRNPFGLVWTTDGKLYASENGFDVRGSRPIANDKEDLYEIKEGAWYGWPDYASGIPVTDAQFAPDHGPRPQFLMADHPPVEKPVLTFPKHSAATKLAVARNDAFGQKGKLFLAFFGHMAPMTGKVEDHAGHRVVSIDPATLHVETFFTKRERHSGQSGGDGHGGHSQDSSSGGRGSGAGHGRSGKGESITAGPRRLVDVVFSPEGDALYVVDFGSMVVMTEPMPIRETGVIWQITRHTSHADPQSPEAPLH